MTPELTERIAYGRLVRERAQRLFEAHGLDAAARAREEGGDALFLAAVELRLARLAAAPRFRQVPRRPYAPRSEQALAAMAFRASAMAGVVVLRSEALVP